MNHRHGGRGGSVDDPQGERGAVVLEGDMDAAKDGAARCSTVRTSSSPLRRR